MTSLTVIRIVLTGAFLLGVKFVVDLIRERPRKAPFFRRIVSKH
jgi:hypothetical protein